MLAEAVKQIDMQGLVDRVIESFWNRPGFEGARPSQSELRAFVRWNIDLVVRWVVHGEPPTDAELEPIRSMARELATAGVPADTVPANYRIATKLAWRELNAALGDAERAALLERGHIVLEYVDRISSVFAEGYEEGAPRAASSATERGVQALLSRLRRGELPLADDHQVAEAIGFDLDAPACAFALACPRLSVQQHVALARRLRARRALAVAEGRRVVGLAPETMAWSSLDLGGDAIICEAPVLAPTEAGRTLDEVSTVVEIARERGHRGLVSADQFLIELMLSHTPRLAARVAERVYGPLSAELVRTLDVLVECNFDRGLAANALPTHRNTLRNRLMRVQELTGLDVDTVEGRALTTLAWITRSGLPGPAGDGHSSTGAVVDRRFVRHRASLDGAPPTALRPRKPVARPAGG